MLDTMSNTPVEASKSPLRSQLDAAFDPERSRFVVGIDLGTTNCAMAYVDTQAQQFRSSDPTRASHPISRVEVFAIEQLVDFGVAEKLSTLPSFHYELAPRELEGIDPTYRFGATPATAHSIVGALARERVVQAPGRGFGSAKSWLCHGLVDRTSDLLPWQGEDSVEKLSPVEASRRYLEHLRRQWDRRFPGHPLANQDVVVTLPASFDEVARQLTLNAAQRAGLNNVLLIEEPQAAFYAWLDRHQHDWDSHLRSGDTILVCDIGGGTTDFTLIRVLDAQASDLGSAQVENPASSQVGTSAQGSTSAVNGINSADQSDLAAAGLDEVLRKKRLLRLHRVAVGKHLMLGGDNMDLALARLLELKIGDETERLSPRQWEALIGNARKAKEALLSDSAPEQFSITLPGVGAKLVGGSKTLSVTRDWAQKTLLEGFFGKVSLDARPAATDEGFQEFGLPYESEPNVMVHLATFLWEHRWAGRQTGELIRHDLIQHERIQHEGVDLQRRAARPDWVLFNGGVLESPLVQQAILDQLTSWFSDPTEPNWKPKALLGNRLDLAVAQGAASFGLVRRGEGVRIDARLAKAYYIIVSQNPKRVMCVMPATAMPLDRFCLSDQPFDLLLGQPVQFPLISSSSQLNHTFGEVIDFDPKTMTELPPICTVLEEQGRKGKESIRVQLETELSEIGTLKMSLVRVDPAQRWNLEFDVRGGQVLRETGAADDATVTQSGRVQRVVHQDVIGRAESALDEIFSMAGNVKPKEAFALLSEAVGIPRREWPTSLLREIWRGLLDRNAGRSKSPEHEGRWLNLVGWCLRPGYGFPVDDWRVQTTWKTVHNKLSHKSAANVSEAMVLWRRISGGFTAGQQQALYQDTWPRVRGLLAGTGHEQLNLNVLMEQMRLLGSMERLKASDKSAMVDAAFAGLGRRKLEPLHDGLLWMIGRLGNRVPVYATIQQTPAIERVESWITKLMQLDAGLRSKPAYPLSLMLLSRKTGDRYRDIGERLRGEVAPMLAEMGHTRFASLVSTGGGLDQEQLDTVVGETLPLGFRLST